MHRDFSLTQTPPQAKAQMSSVTGTLLSARLSLKSNLPLWQDFFRRCDQHKSRFSVILLEQIGRHGCCSLAGMLAHGINHTVLDLTTQNSISANRIRFPYRFVLQDAPEEPQSPDPRRHFRWTHVVAKTLRRLER